MAGYVWLFLLVSSALPYPEEQTCERAVDIETEQNLFTFNSMLIAASSVANRHELLLLGNNLLADKPNPMVDSRYPIRKILRNAIEHVSVATRKRMLTFLLQHPTAVTNYNALVTQLFAAAPNFTPRSQGAFGGPQEQHIYQDRDEFAALLQAMHQEGVGQLWIALQPLWAKHQFCQNFITSVHSSLQRYTKVTWQLPTASLIIVNPLMPAESGVTSIYADGHFVTLVGPSQSNRGQAILLAHELAHPLVHRIWDNNEFLRQTLQSSSCVYQQLMQTNHQVQLADAVYNNWSSYFSEGLVRAISHRMMHTTDRQSTILLADKIDEQLKQYEQINTLLPNYLATMLQTLQQQYCGTKLVQLRKS